MQKDFNAWNEKKKQIQNKKHVPNVHEREIWWCSLGSNIGDEEDGKNELFERPVLIIKKFNSRIVLVVPLTTISKDSQYYFPCNINGKPQTIIISQLRLISTRRMIRPHGKISPGIFKRIKTSIIRKCIN